MVLYMNVRQGRHGRYAFATLDDGSSKIEVSIWAEPFELYRNALRKGQLVVVEGIVEKNHYTKGSHKIIKKLQKSHNTIKKLQKSYKIIENASEIILNH